MQQPQQQYGRPIAQSVVFGAGAGGGQPQSGAYGGAQPGAYGAAQSSSQDGLQFYQSNYGAATGASTSGGWTQPCGYGAVPGMQQQPAAYGAADSTAARVYVGSPWGSGGYADEQPLWEGVEL